MSTSSPRDPDLRRAHPLAIALIERLASHRGAQVLEFGTGSGRNTAALVSAGLSVQPVADDCTQTFEHRGRFDAALSTHALLHGTPETVARMVGQIAASLAGSAPFYATFGSKNDARYGEGIRIEDDAYAPAAGEERGVVHAFFNETALRAMLQERFAVESIEERAVDDVVGTWAHVRRPRGSVHWFVRATRAPEDQ